MNGKIEFSFGRNIGVWYVVPDTEGMEGDKIWLYGASIEVNPDENGWSLQHKTNVEFLLFLPRLHFVIGFQVGIDFSDWSKRNG